MRSAWPGSCAPGSSQRCGSPTSGTRRCASSREPVERKQAKVAVAPQAVGEIAWKAQCRLNARYRALTRNGKLKTVAVTAIARELCGFIWAINREITGPRAAARQ